MTPDNVSPEERLFKVIQDQKNAPVLKPESAAEEKRPGDAGTVRRFFAGVTVGRFLKELRYRMRMPALAGHIHEIQIGTVNKALVGVAALMALAEIYCILFGGPDIAKITKALSDAEIQDSREPRKIEALKPVSYYIDQVKKKSMFFSAKTADKGPVNLASQVSRLNDAAKDIKLKGISWGKVPKAIIKNEKEDKVYFLGEEQAIGSTGIEVRTILKRKVIIGSGDEEMELQ
ncbi:MAG: hypothetical protein WC592_03350 [Candidatus Omnitrophota bacterium]|nr:hypothetical protein [Candidatus Omnitrophota bacterium]